MDSVENEITKAVLAAEVVDAPASVVECVKKNVKKLEVKPVIDSLAEQCELAVEAVDVKQQIPRKFQFFISTLDGSVIS